MHILSIESISKTYGLKPLFEGVSLGLDSEDRIGVVGVNGSGKTTLLRLIARQQKPDSGQIVFAAGVSIGYLPQNPPFEPGQTVLEAVFATNNARMKLLLAYELACQELGADGQAGGRGDERQMNRVSELAHELEASGAWELETNARPSKRGAYLTSHVRTHFSSKFLGVELPASLTFLFPLPAKLSFQTSGIANSRRMELLGFRRLAARNCVQWRQRIRSSHNFHHLNP